MKPILSTLTLTLSLAAGLGLGCDVLGGDDRRNQKNGPAAAKPGDGPREIDPARPAFQAKSAVQLTRSIEACVGAGAVTVTEPMIATPENRTGFLTSDFAVDADIVDVQKSLFDGTADALRTGVRVDQVTLEYLTALKNVANVVGTRCAGEAVATPEQCACETEAQAKEMLSRCLAAVADPSTPDFVTLAKDFHGACQASRATAIASMIASLAFAKVP